MLHEYNSALVLKSHVGALLTLLLHHGSTKFFEVASWAQFD